jgi:hypothetical protein
MEPVGGGGGASSSPPRLRRPRVDSPGRLPELLLPQERPLPPPPAARPEEEDDLITWFFSSPSHPSETDYTSFHLLSFRQKVRAATVVYGALGKSQGPLPSRGVGVYGGGGGRGNYFCVCVRLLEVG